MALMERVATLIRANLNDLIDQAEDPGKMLKQVMLDMHNQLMQVKTQVAIAIADHHLLAKKQKEHEAKGADWVRKAQLAVDAQQDDLAREALDRSLQSEALAQGFAEQARHQSAQVDNLKSALFRLQEKLAEAQTKCDLLVAQRRRARSLEQASAAQEAIADGTGELTLNRVQNRVEAAEALGQAKAALNGESLGERLAALDKREQVERLLAGMKAKK